MQLQKDMGIPDENIKDIPIFSGNLNQGFSLGEVAAFVFPVPYPLFQFEGEKNPVMSKYIIAWFPKNFSRFTAAHETEHICQNLELDSSYSDEIKKYKEQGADASACAVINCYQCLKFVWLKKMLQLPVEIFEKTDDDGVTQDGYFSYKDVIPYLKEAYVNNCLCTKHQQESSEIEDSLYPEHHLTEYQPVSFTFHNVLKYGLSYIMAMGLIKDYGLKI